jgi:Putative auto-transporter adhesin, head GIN domain
MKTTRVIVFACLASLFLIGYAKPDVKGSGKVVKENRETGIFTRIVVSNAIEVVLTKADKEQVIVEAEDNVIASVIVENNGEKLNIRMKDLPVINTTVSVKVYVSYTQLSEIFVSGASKLSATEPLQGEKLLLILSGASQSHLPLQVQWLSVNCSGASKGTVTGSADKLNIQCSGASGFIARELQAKEVDIDASGASNIQVDAQLKLNIVASGASSVQYVKHDDVVINRSTSGASSAEPL